MKAFTENQQRLNQTQADYQSMDQKLTGGLNNMLKDQLNDIHNLEEEFRKIKETDDGATLSVKQIIATVVQMKDKLKKDVFALNAKIEDAEIAVGYE